MKKPKWISDELFVRASLGYLKQNDFHQLIKESTEAYEKANWFQRKKIKRFLDKVDKAYSS